MVRDGHKGIAFRIVAGEASLRDVVATHDKAADMAADAVVDRGSEPDDFPFFQALPCDIGRIHEQYHARAKDAAEPIAIRIDGRVELSLAADGRELEDAGLPGRTVDIAGEGLGHDRIRDAIEKTYPDIALSPPTVIWWYCELICVADVTSISAGFF